MKTSLQEIVHTYDKTQSRLSLESTIYSGSYFSDKTAVILKKTLSLSEYLICKRIMVLSGKALKASRQRKLHTAEEYYQQANFNYWLPYLGLEARLNCVSSLCSTRAYFKYCEEKFHEAKDIVFQANDADIVLEERFGISILHMHRIQLAHNLIRIDVRTGNYSRALSRSIEAIQYLNLGVFNISFLKGHWGPSFLKMIEPKLIQGMTIQILHEMVFINSLEWNEGTQEIVTGYRGLIDNPSLAHRLRQWLILKIAYYENNMDSFLEGAIVFMRNEEGATSLLYFILILDLLSFLRTADVDPTIMKEFSSRIYNDLPQWKNIPGILSKKIKNYIQT